MISHDSHICKKYLHNQEIIFPNLEAWRDLIREGHLNDMPLWTSKDWIAMWLDEYATFEVAYLGLVQWNNKWLPIPFLFIENQYFRVHFENVICEHCKQRCGASATPDTVSYACTGLTLPEIWAEFDVLPIQHCPHCGELLRRRQIIWLAAAQTP
jgi:hypothetical protein